MPVREAGWEGEAGPGRGGDQLSIEGSRVGGCSVAATSSACEGEQAGWVRQGQGQGKGRQTGMEGEAGHHRAYHRL